MQNFKKYSRHYLLGTLFVIVAFIWCVVITEGREGVLTVAFLDVGQGDAIFIEAPNGNQVLVDGGPNNSVLRELNGIMPFYDRSIDVVVATHPDKDHIGGLPSILEKFKVDIFIEPGVISNSGTYKAIGIIDKEKNIKKVLAKRGQRIILDKNVYIDTLFPDRSTLDWETNTASVVMRLVYGDTSFLLTGDSPKRIEEYIASLDREGLTANVLKLGHHGSRTSTSEFFLSAVNPQYAIISAGTDNRYGHPHKEVVDMLKRFEIPSLATYENGTIIIQSDGENIKVEY